MKCQNDNETLINRYGILILEKIEFLDLDRKHTLDQMSVRKDCQELELHFRWCQTEHFHQMDHWNVQL